MARKSRLEPQRIALAPNKNVCRDEKLESAVLDPGSARWREYSTLMKTALAAIPVCGLDLLAWYGELQYKTRGPGKCSQCRAPVRHALKVRAERTDGSTRTYVCLCTRCLVAEESLSTRVLYRVAGRWVESQHAREKAARRTRTQAA